MFIVQSTFQPYLSKKFTDSNFAQWFGDVMKTLIFSGKKQLLQNAQK